MEDEKVVSTAETDEASQAQDDFASVREHFEAGQELSDEEVDKIADVAVGYLKAILSYFGENGVSIDEYDGDDGELILDVNGGTLDALQMIVTSFMSNRLKFHYPIVVDIEGYKGRRKQKLQSLALSAASRAKKQGRVALPPMNAYERRIVHLALVDDAEVTTHSEGSEPERRVVVTSVR